MILSLFHKGDYVVSFRRGTIIYALVSAFCIIFSVVYEIAFAHGVVSWFMRLFFLVPLICGTLVSVIFWRVKKLPGPGRITLNAYNSGIAAITVGVMMEGVFEIAYTDSLTGLYLIIAGGMMCLFAIFLYLFSDLRYKKQ